MSVGATGSWEQGSENSLTAMTGTERAACDDAAVIGAEARLQLAEAPGGTLGISIAA